MTTYLAFLRGINVGGNSLIKMADLKDALSAAGLQEVRTYIQSGNVIFASEGTDKAQLGAHISETIQQRFALQVDVVVFTKAEWEHIIAAAPAWWGKDKTWKHNMLIMTKPHDMSKVIQAIGELKPDIEAVQPGMGVVYQSMSFQQFGKTTTGKLASNPIYKQMTIRNYNTATKLLSLLG